MKLEISKKYILMYVIFSLFISAFYILFGHELSNVLDILIMKQSAYSHALIWMAVFFILFIIMSFLYNRYTARVSHQLVTEKGKALIDSVDVNSVRNSESVLNALFVHLDKYRPYQSSFVPTVVLTTVKVVLIISALLFVEPIAAIILAITAPFVPLFYILVGLKTEDEALEQADEYDDMGTLFLNLVRGKDTIQYTNSEKEVETALQESNNQFLNTTMRILKYAFQSTLMLEFITILGIGLIALEVGLRIIIFENITFYQSFFALLMAPEFYSSLKVMGTEFHNGKTAQAHLEKINQVVTPKKEEYRKHGNSLRLENITLETDRILLANTTIDFKNTGLIAITGHSGVGKTTLLNTIAGLKQPKEGLVYIPTDDFGYISDAIYLSDISFYEYFQKKDRQEIERVLRVLNLYDSIMNLEHGLDTVVVNNNVPLSGGEIVRLKLARILITQPQIILMDEPTEFLDRQTENIVLNYLNELKHDHLIITVVHRKALLDIADYHFHMEHQSLEEVR